MKVHWFSVNGQTRLFQNVVSLCFRLSVILHTKLHAQARKKHSTSKAIVHKFVAYRFNVANKF
jgi:hypothetical protein